MKITLLELFAIVTLAAVLLICSKWMAHSWREINNGTYSLPWELKR